MMRSVTLILCLYVILHACSIKADTNQVPLTKLGAKTGPTVKFFYCYSCGYRKVFEEYVNILRQKYPKLQIDGENYNPPGYKMAISKFLVIAMIIVMFLILNGTNVIQPTPPLWQWCIDNRCYSCLMLFFIYKAIEGQLISSGAFEIHFNDVPIWSKLETGRTPQPFELFQIIDTNLNMQYEDVDIG